MRACLFTASLLAVVTWTVSAKSAYSPPSGVDGDGILEVISRHSARQENSDVGAGSGIVPPPLPSNWVTTDPATFVLSSDWDINEAPIVREFNFDIKAAAANPDGYARQVYTVNGQFPAPLIEANTGDTIRVHVTNSLADGQTIHWHGLSQNGSNWADGVPGVTQCPIPPGGNFTYEFKIIEQYGTYWYHSHYANTMADGIAGPLIIHSPDEPLKRGEDYDEERVLMISDWMHDQSNDIVAALRSSDGYRGSLGAPSGDSILINGVGKANCTDPNFPAGSECSPPSPTVIDVPVDKKIRLRIINTAAHAMLRVSIDSHDLEVVEADTDPVYGPTLHEIPIAPAQRYSLIVSTNQGKSGDKFWLRVNSAAGCMDKKRQEGVAVFRYGGTNDTSEDDSEPTTEAWDDLAEFDSPCRDLDQIHRMWPRLAIDANETPLQTRVLSSQFGTFLGVDGNNVTGFGFNNVSFQNQIFDPLLPKVQNEGLTTFKNIASIEFNTTQYADVVLNNLDGGIDHPFHLHGNEFQLIARGEGNVTAEDVEMMGLNIDNPLRRDTIFIPAGTYAVLRIKMDNPGIWAVHCHIGWHLAVGKLATIIVRPDDMKDFEEPEEWKALCAYGDPGQVGPSRRSLTSPASSSLESKYQARSLRQVKARLLQRSGSRDA